MATKSKAHAPAKAQPVAFVPDAERIDLARQLLDKTYTLGRALESMQDGAFNDPHEACGEVYYFATSRELGTRVRAMTEATLHLLIDPGYETGTAWGVLHG